MKIAMCGSMSFAKEMLEYKDKLEKRWWYVELPSNTQEHAQKKMTKENLEEKIQYNSIMYYHGIIGMMDAVFVLNLDKNWIQNYIGWNTFLEIGFAFVQKKTIFLLNPVPDMIYKDEIIAMNPIVLNSKDWLRYDWLRI